MAAKKKVEVSLQDEIETQEDWENTLQKEGLLVIDIYQSWAGPCKAAMGLFRRLKAELNDDYLNFAVARADTVESLEKYRGRCEPCFLFFGGGNLVAVVRGINPPELEKNILSKLKQEHEVIKGECERVVIRDPLLLAQELAEEEERRRREEEEEIEQEVTVAVLKPDIVSAGRVDEMIEELTTQGIEILDRKEHLFTKEEAEEFYEAVKSEPYFGKLVEFMTSGPSEILVCAKGAEGVIESLRGLIGPAITEEGEEIGLRAKYGTDELKNAIHAPDGAEEAARELAFFYPDFQRPIVRVRRVKIRLDTSGASDAEETRSDEKSQEEIPRTVALIRPHVFAKYEEAILERIQEAGFTIASKKEVQLTKEQAEMIYKEHVGETYFGDLTTIMSSGPILALLLARQDAVEMWRKLIGPKNLEEAKLFNPRSLRTLFPAEEAEYDEEGGNEFASIYGSASEPDAQRDVELLFPVERTVAMIKPDAYANRDEIIERIKMAGFHVAARRDTQLTPEIAKQLYANHQNQPFFEDLVHHITSGPTLFMVLTRQDAVSGWRKLMGPADPDKAVEEQPDSIRAIYGRNILENAVHGSSSIEHAVKTIELIFENADVGVLEKEAAAEKSESIEKEVEEEVQEKQLEVKEEGADVDKPTTEENMEKEAEVEEDASPGETGEADKAVLEEQAGIGGVPEVAELDKPTTGLPPEQAVNEEAATEAALEKPTTELPPEQAVNEEAATEAALEKPTTELPPEQAVNEEATAEAEQAGQVEENKIDVEADVEAAVPAEENETSGPKALEEAEKESSHNSEAQNVENSNASQRISKTSTTKRTSNVSTRPSMTALNRPSFATARGRGK